MVVGSVFLGNLIALSSNSSIQPQKIQHIKLKKKNVEKCENDKEDI